jgi:hypothetical protein
MALSKVNPNFVNVSQYGRRNLIINGAMQVAQRGTSFTSTADIYTLDRFAVGHGSPVNAMTVEQSTDAPNNFKNSIKITAGTGASASTTGYAVLRQAIEGYNISHLGFGSSAAKAILLSFYVKSSLTGTFGVSIRNQAGNRGYGGTYIINSANTWEYVTIAIPADTGGTWPTDSGIGSQIMWDLGAGSNYDIASGSWIDSNNVIGVESTVKLTETTGATFQLTGVQLELGDTATPFEHLSWAEELQLCQRYFQYVSQYFEHNIGTTGTFGSSRVSFATPMRANPTYTVTSSGGSGTVTLNGFSTKNIEGIPTTYNLSYTSTSNGYIYYDATAKADSEL